MSKGVLLLNSTQAGINDKLTNEPEEPDPNSQRIISTELKFLTTDWEQLKQAVYTLNGCAQNENGSLKCLSNLHTGPKPCIFHLLSIIKLTKLKE